MKSISIVRLILAITAFISIVEAQASCSSSSPDCCWVVRVWQLMGKSTSVSSASLTNCCSMTGVTCSNAAVTILSWNSKGLSGSIPSDIGNLKNLVSM